MRPQARAVDSGQDLIEFALILPLLILLLLGVTEFGLVMMRYNTIANAAREGARTGVIRPDDKSAIEAATRAITNGLDEDDLNVIVSRPTVRSVQVEITYVHHFITTPIIVAVGGDGTLTMRTVSTMNIE